MSDIDKIIEVNIEDQMKSSYIDYSMSVIVSRALPDVRDGLKPVHRRILYAMDELGLTANKPYKKSARVVGEVLGKYHPHSDTAVYDAMIRLGQPWSMRYPLVDIQGNKGSVDGDSPAAMRYTEARLDRISDQILNDIKKETVDFGFNFDDSLEEPTVLPTRLPNLLVNGASGIAVGMATNMLPHNLTEVIGGCMAYIENEEITVPELMNYIKGPDFPTGGIIYGTSGIVEAYETGRGRVVVRSKAEIVDAGTHERIVITEIPYQVNKANLIVKIANLVKEEKIDGIASIKDLSDRTGMSISIDLKRDAIGQVVLSNLFKYTPLQTSYGINNVALVNGRPETLNLKRLIEEFIKFRIEVIVRRTQYDLRKAEERAHVLEGLIIAVNNLDEVIQIIRSSRTVDDARDSLMSKFELSEIQAKAILDMRLSKLTGLEIEKLKAEYDDLMKLIEELKSILASEEKQKGIVKQELQELLDTYGDERMTSIIYADGEINIEDLIPNNEVVVTISKLGYIKRTNAEEYRQQSRGGKGAKGVKTRDEDFVENLFIANNHNYLLLFTEAGRCFWLRVYEIPEAAKNSMGRIIQNIIQLPKEDKIRAYIVIEDLENEEFNKNNYLIFATKKGQVKKTALEAYSRPRANGINAITIREDDQLIEVKLTDGKSDILLGNRNGRAIRFLESDVRTMGRTAAGVRGMRLDDDQDEVIGMIQMDPDDPEHTVMNVSEKGYGKRTLLEDYRITKRGGKGVKTMNVTDKTGKLIAIKSVTQYDDLMITNRSGIVIRMSLDSVRVMGRNTQGVKLISLSKDDQIADVALVKRTEEEYNNEEE